MRYDICFLPDVKEDVVAGYRWYKGKGPGLADILRLRGLS